MTKSIVLPAAALSVLFLGVAGCGGAAQNGAQPGAGKNLDAEQILRHMVDAYKSADAYSDKGVLIVSYNQGGQVVREETPLAIQFRRPNSLSVRAYQVSLASDGAKLQYRVQHGATGDMDNQFIERNAPSELTLSGLFNDPSAGRFDQVLQHFLTGGAHLPFRHELLPPQLGLLLSKDAFAEFLKDDIDLRLLEERSLDGHRCHRVAAETYDGTFVLWIDQQNSLLRRFEYPFKSFLPTIAEQDGVSEAALAADLRDAKLAASSADQAYQLPAPTGSLRVRHFVPLPAKIPSPLIGKRLNEFSFTDPRGGEITRDDLDGKITALLWFNEHPSAEANLPIFDKLRRKYRAGDRVGFFAVCTEPSTAASNAQLTALLKSWNVDVPLLRDLGPYGEQVFGIEALPTLVILDEKGVVQYFEVLDQPRLEESLEGALGVLLSGKDLAREVLAQHEANVDNYRRQLRAAGAPDTSAIIDLPAPRIQNATEPSRLTLNKLWACDKLTAPGNLLVVGNTAAESRLLVFDGWRTIAELNQAGNVIAQRELDLPEGEAVSYLRTIADGEGRRFYLAGQAFGKQIHVFDGDWKRLFAYPPKDAKHGGISDAQMLDLNADGTPEIYVGFWELLGVHQVALDGKTLNRDRSSMPQVLSLAPSTKRALGRRMLLVSGSQGSIVRMNEYLRPDRPIAVFDQAISHVFKASYEEGDFAVYCGLNFRDQDTLVAVGLSEDFEAVWTCEMSSTPTASQIQFVTSGKLLDRPGGQWVIARPDGSIHFKSDDGEFEDKFFYGENLTGIAVARFEAGPVLVVASDRAVTAWRVNLADKAENN